MGRKFFEMAAPSLAPDRPLRHRQSTTAVQAVTRGNSYNGKFTSGLVRMAASWGQLVTQAGC
jgi:hypothetical protein